MNRDHRIEHRLSNRRREAARGATDHLATCGFVVQQGARDLPTALVARAGRGSLHVALRAEYDALPGIGHACGHNLIAVAAAGAGAGLAAVADDLDLTVLVIGTPGEGLYSLAGVPDDVRGPGKALLLERGAFDGVHLALMHPAPVDIATTPHTPSSRPATSPTTQCSRQRSRSPGPPSTRPPRPRSGRASGGSSATPPIRRASASVAFAPTPGWRGWPIPARIT